MSTFDWGWNGSTQRDSDGAMTSAQGGVGVLNATGDGVDARSLWAGGQIGSGDQPDGSYFHGLKGSAQSGGMSWDPAVAGESGFWGGVAGPQLSYEQYASDSMASWGYTQNTGSGSIGYRQVGESDHDRGMRVGLGVGPLCPAIPGGAGVRAHYGDADGDHEREYGFGASVPLAQYGIPATASFDYVTETPLLDSVAVMALGAPVAGAALAGVTAGAMLDEEYGLSDSLAGVENSYGTRGAPKFPSEMTEEERFFQQWFGS